MKLEKALPLVLCALLAIVCGCGTEEPDADQVTAEAVAEPEVDQETTPVVVLPLEGFTNSIGMKFNLIPAGEFMMGSPEDKEGHSVVDEGPVHRVRITKPYYLSVTEVTQGQWEGVMGTRPWEGEEYTKSNPRLAVSHVNWRDAVVFCQKLMAKEGREYRLPTEAEWEYACRAGSRNQFCFGDERSSLDSYAWYDENTYDAGEQYAHEVGLKFANAWGLHDMHGNVYEWCLDRYNPDYYKSSRTENPVGSTLGPYRVNRGGSWVGHSNYCRSAARFSKPLDCQEPYIGFRVALIPAE